MAKYRPFECRKWDSAEFEDMSAHKILIYLYLWGNVNTTESGIYEVTPKNISEHTHIPKPTVENLLLEGIDGILYDFENKICFVRDFLRDAVSGNPSRIETAILSDNERFKTPLWDEFKKEYRHLKSGFETKNLKSYHKSIPPPADQGDQTCPPGTPDQPPPPQQVEGKKVSKTRLREMFGEFYEAYPKKTARVKAEKEFEKLHGLMTEEFFGQTLMLNLRRQEKEKAALESAGQFAPSWPDPERWLKYNRWTDEFGAEGEGKGTGAAPGASKPSNNNGSEGDIFMFCPHCGAEILKTNYFKDVQRCVKCMDRGKMPEELKKLMEGVKTV